MSHLTPSIGPFDHVRGDPNARVTLTEYGDYECPFCGQAHRVVLHLLGRFHEIVRVVFRHFPLSQAHPHALLAAQAAEAAGAQGKFWEMHDTLFANQHALELADLIAYADGLELDGGRLAGELERETYLDRVRSDFRSGVRSGVNGTPTFFIDGQRFDGSWEEDNLGAVIASAAESRQHATR
jgi:protein-disulfide isomerase